MKYLIPLFLLAGCSQSQSTETPPLSNSEQVRKNYATLAVKDTNTLVCIDHAEYFYNYRTGALTPHFVSMNGGMSPYVNACDTPGKVFTKR
jgi:hypothetical protein